MNSKEATHYTVVCDKRLLWESPHSDIVQKCCVVPYDEQGNDEVAVTHGKLKLSKCFLCNQSIPQINFSSNTQALNGFLFNPMQTLLHYATSHLSYIIKVAVVNVPKSSASSTPAKDTHN